MQKSASFVCDPAARRSAHRILAVLVAGILLQSGFACSFPAAPMEPADSAAHVGDRRTVEGRIGRADRVDGSIHLYFDDAPSFRAVLLPTMFDSPLPELITRYVGRVVRVTGRVRSFKGVEEIVVRGAGDVLIVDPSVEPTSSPIVPSPPAITPAATPPPPAERSDEKVERLERRIEELERRLEHREPVP